MQTIRKTAGAYLREWRGKRHMSQLELANEAEISARHLSFLETGRSQASREVLLRLSEQLDIPLRERNVILLAAGYAPVFEERPLASPEMAAARQAVERVLKGHEPFPALAVDRHWQLVSANANVAPLLAGVDEALLKPPVNVLRLSLHPRGLAPRIANLTEWRTSADASANPDRTDRRCCADRPPRRALAIPGNKHAETTHAVAPR